jgi:hypothetical protein
VNYLRQEKADLEARLGDKKKKKYQKAVVLYDFKGDTSNQQLVLKKGDVLTVTNKHESGWWTGKRFLLHIPLLTSKSSRSCSLAYFPFVRSQFPPPLFFLFYRLPLI